MTTLAERMKECLTEKGWKPADLQRAAKLKSPSTISEILNSGRTRSPQLPVIAEALGVEALWLQHGRGPKKRREDAPVLKVIQTENQLTPLALEIASDAMKLPEDLQIKVKHWIDVELTFIEQEQTDSAKREQDPPKS